MGCNEKGGEGEMCSGECTQGNWRDVKMRESWSVALNFSFFLWRAGKDGGFELACM